jgi:hypothetical protein
LHPLHGFVDVRRLSATGLSSGTQMRVHADGSTDTPAIPAMERAVMRRAGPALAEAA